MVHETIGQEELQRETMRLAYTKSHGFVLLLT